MKLNILCLLFPLALCACGTQAESDNSDENENTFHLVRQHFLRREFSLFDVTLRKDGTATVVTQQVSEAEPSTFELTYQEKQIEGMAPDQYIDPIVFGEEAELPVGNWWNGTWTYEKGRVLSFQSVGLAYDALTWDCKDETGTSYRSSEQVDETCEPYCFGYEWIVLRVPYNI